MQKKEREKLKKLVNKIYDGMPHDRTCECFDLDGEPSEEECDLHWALRKLNDVAEGTTTFGGIVGL